MVKHPIFGPLRLDASRIVLITLLLARGVLAVMPSMWAWGLNAMRFLSPAVVCVSWGLLGISLVPAAGMRLERAMESWRPERVAVRIASILAASILVWIFAGRVWF